MSDQHTATPVPTTTPAGTTTPRRTAAKIGLFYGSSTCYTEIAAEKIRDCIGPEYVALHNISTSPLSLADNYHYLILGIPTWDYGELQEDWENHWEQLSQINWSTKVVAVYGLGDQIGYPQWYQDAMGYLWARVKQLGATTIGEWPTLGYQFESSTALTEDGEHFVGLALDDESEFELSEERIALWCQQIVAGFE